MDRQAARLVAAGVLLPKHAAGAVERAGRAECRRKPSGSRHSEGSIAKDRLAVGLGSCQNPAGSFHFPEQPDNREICERCAVFFRRWCSVSVWLSSRSAVSAQNPGGSAEGKKMKNPVPRRRSRSRPVRRRSRRTAGSATARTRRATVRWRRRTRIPRTSPTPSGIADRPTARSSSSSATAPVPKFEMKGYKSAMTDTDIWNVVELPAEHRSQEIAARDHIPRSSASARRRACRLGGRLRSRRRRLPHARRPSRARRRPPPTPLRRRRIRRRSRRRARRSGRR